LLLVSFRMSLSRLPSILERISHITASVSGYDKILRLILYSNRLIITLLSPSLVSTSTLEPLQNIASQFSSTRLVLRLLSSIDIIQMTWSNHEKTFLKRLIFNLQTISLLVYSVAEMISWLNEMGVLKKVNGSTYGRISCGGWLAWIIFDLVRQFLEWKELKKEEEMDETFLKRCFLMLAITKNLMDTALAYNWTCEKPVLTPLQVATAGTIGSLIGVFTKWENTPEMEDE